MRVICSHVLVALGIVFSVLLLLGSRIDSREEMAVVRAWDVAVGLMFVGAYLLSRSSTDSSVGKRRWPVVLKAILIGVVMGGWLVLFQEAVWLARMTVSPRVLAANQVRIVFNTLQEYRDDHGKFPTTEQGLAALFETAPRPSWSYVDTEALVDPWGHPLRYRNEDDVIEVWSLGPDGQTGTDDDIREAAKSKPAERADPPRD